MIGNRGVINQNSRSGIKTKYLDFRGLVSGTVDHVEYGSQIVSTQSFSVECWVKMDDISTPHNVNGQFLINERGPNATTEWNYQLNWQKTQQRFNIATRNNANTDSYVANSDGSGVTVNSNTWYHVAAVCDADSTANTIIMNLYLNGFLGTSSTNSEPVGRFIAASNNFRLGTSGFNAITSGAVALIGSLDEVRIWNHARTAEQINRYKDVRLFGSETGLLAYYRMDEGTGNTVFDKSLNSNDATRVNAPWVTL
jgi:hypothetical protein